MATMSGGSGTSGSAASAPYYGVYRALVAGTTDPQNQGRVLINIPALGLGNMWAPACRGPGGGRGSPSVGANCIVAFEAGDVQRPVMLGLI
jgi:hypothetical protein